jgi:hypothetical protein
VRSFGIHAQDSAAPRGLDGCRAARFPADFWAVRESVGPRARRAPRERGSNGRRASAGGCRPSQGRLPGVGGLNGRALSWQFRSPRRKARLFSARLAFRSRGTRYGAGGSPQGPHQTPRRAPAVPGHAFECGLAARPGGSVEKGQALRWAGPPAEGVLRDGRRRSDVKVGPGAPSAESPRRFFVQEPCGSEGVGSAPCGVRCGGWQHRTAPDALLFSTPVSRHSTTFCGRGCNNSYILRDRRDAASACLGHGAGR